jgi:hypothetical protein
LPLPEVFESRREVTLMLKGSFVLAATRFFAALMRGEIPTWE